MSYGMAAALQEALYQRLAGDDGLAALVGAAIFDAVPSGTPPGTFVLIGPEEVRERSDRTGGGAEHRLVVSVVTDAQGFLVAKQAAARVSDVLDGADLALARGRLVGLWFDRAEARQLEQGTVRRIDLRFRARVEDDI